MPVSGWYLSSTATIPPRYNKTIGIIQQPGQYGLYRVKLDKGIPWGFDNGVFSNTFVETEWLNTLQRLQEYNKTCLFVAMPDVYADAQGTLDRYLKYRALVVGMGYKTALVTQDGISQLPGNLPWKEIDALFIGGTNEHKLGKEGVWVILQGLEHNKWVHVGRVNSVKRLFRFWYADSWDGTHLSYAPKDARKFHLAILQIRAMKKQKRLVP